MQDDFNLFTYAKNLKKTEIEQVGIEYTPDEETYEKEVPYNADEIRITNKVLSVFQVYSYIKEGSVNLMPSFQRHIIWNQRQKSLLIESLMLRILLPAFYFDEDVDGNNAVIDGLQRLSAISEFMDNCYPLEELQYLSDTCEGRYFKDLPPKYVKRIQEAQLNINVLDERCPDQVKLDVFRRVNTGGVPLNDQEIRNVLANDQTRKLLKKMSNSDAFLTATRNLVNDIRMDAQELCLRFIAFEKFYDPEMNIIRTKERTMKLLDNTITDELNKLNEEQLYALYERFNVSMKKCYAFLGELTFSKPDGTAFINKPLFTSWSVIMAHTSYTEEELYHHQEIAKEKFHEALEVSRNYYNVITVHTTSKKSLDTQFYIARKILEDTMHDNQVRINKLQVL